MGVPRFNSEETAYLACILYHLGLVMLKPPYAGFILLTLPLWTFLDSWKREGPLRALLWATAASVLVVPTCGLYLGRRKLLPGEERSGGRGWNVCKNMAWLSWTAGIGVGTGIALQVLGKGMSELTPSCSSFAIQMCVARYAPRAATAGAAMASFDFLLGLVFYGIGRLYLLRDRDVVETGSGTDEHANGTAAEAGTQGGRGGVAEVRPAPQTRVAAGGNVQAECRPGAPAAESGSGGERLHSEYAAYAICALEAGLLMTFGTMKGLVLLPLPLWILLDAGKRGHGIRSLLWAAAAGLTPLLAVYLACRKPLPGESRRGGFGWNVCRHLAYLSWSLGAGIMCSVLVLMTTNMKDRLDLSSPVAFISSILACLTVIGITGLVVGLYPGLLGLVFLGIGWFFLRRNRDVVEEADGSGGSAVQTGDQPLHP